MIQTTLTFIKPDHILQADDIFADLNRIATKIITFPYERVPRELIAEHYAPHKGKFFYERLVNSIADMPIIFGIYQGENVISKLVDAIGPTDPKTAEPTTIRGKYSSDSLEQAISQNRTVRNVIHRSDSVEEYLRERQVWYDVFKGSSF